MFLALLVALGVGAGIRLWDVDTGQHKHILEDPRGVESVAYSPEQRTLASSDSEGTIQLWDIDTGQHKQHLRLRMGAVNAITYSPDGKMFASATDSEESAIRLWDVDTGQCRTILEGHSGPIESIVFSPDGKTLVSGGWEDIWLWDTDTGTHKATLKDGARFPCVLSGWQNAC